MVPGIGSEAIGAGTGLGAAFDALPQFAAEAEGSTGAEDRQGTGGAIRFILDDAQSRGLVVGATGSGSTISDYAALARKSHAARRKNSADADSINPGCDSCADCNGIDCARP
jgi:hypothetical protein